jgi:hypothetical protein
MMCVICGGDINGQTNMNMSGTSQGSRGISGVDSRLRSYCF